MKASPSLFTKDKKTRFIREKVKMTRLRHQKTRDLLITIVRLNEHDNNTHKLIY